MLSIQMYTKRLELVISHQFNNIKLSFFASHLKSSLSFAVRLLDTLEYYTSAKHIKPRLLFKLKM